MAFCNVLNDAPPSKDKLYELDHDGILRECVWIIVAWSSYVNNVSV
jgi:hypothetical protein